MLESEEEKEKEMKNIKCFECNGLGLIANQFILSIWKNPNLTDVQKVEQSNQYYKDNREELREFTCYVCQGNGIIPEEDGNECLWRAISSLDARVKMLEAQKRR